MPFFLRPPREWLAAGRRATIAAPRLFSGHSSLPPLDISGAQTLGDFWGEFTQDLPQSAGGMFVNKVGDVWGGYDVSQAGHGDQVLAANPTGGNFASYRFAGKSGDRVLCRWSMTTGRYFIAAIEPNDAGYQTLDVVTDADFGAQTVARIELAPRTEVA
jgi:hypothetical protein